MTKISVIIPHYNSPDKLIRLIDSIEDSDDIEVIIIDDKSSIDISSIYNKVENRTNTLLIENNRDKKGAGVSRNIGIDNSTGEWLLFADADDFFLDNAWTHVKSLLNSKSDIIYFAPTSIEEGTGRDSDRHHIYESLVREFLASKDSKSELSLRAKFIVPWSKLIKKSLIDKYKIYFDEIIVSNDIMFSVKVGMHAQSISAVDESIYCATKDSKTLSTSVSFEKYKIRTNTYIEYHKYLQDKLKRHDYLNLEIYGAGWLFKGISEGIPLRYIIDIFNIMRKNKIIIAPADLSIFSRGLQNIKSHLKGKKYLK